MNRKSKRDLCLAAGLIAAFLLWTVLVITVDVMPVGPESSAVGMATLNKAFHDLTGVHMWLYDATDILSIIPLCFIAGFAMLGLVQLIRRKSLLKVDRDILVLGGFYLVVMAVFLLFEVFAVNYRPLLIDGTLEASYPSSTTMLAMCVMPTAAMQLGARIKGNMIRRCIIIAITTFTVFMVTARLISGVHWLSDIIGGALPSAGLVMGYKLFAGRGR